MQGIDYLFSEMLQERSKLKSLSCTIAGTEHGRSIEMKLLVNEEKVRFTRKRHIPEHDAELFRGTDEKGKLIKTGEIVHIPEHDYVEHTCDNGLMTASWHVDVFNQQCNIHKSSPSLRELFSVWDPRTACLIPDREGTDYQNALNGRLKFWRDSFTIERKGALWTGTFAKMHEFDISRLFITVDTEHGFTPILYGGDLTYKPNSLFPGRVDIDYEGTAKWKEINGVWVPIHHRYVRGDGQLITEYKVCWDWINKDVDDMEFTFDALGVPGDVQKIHMDESGHEIRKKES